MFWVLICSSSSIASTQLTVMSAEPQKKKHQMKLKMYFSSRLKTQVNTYELNYETSGKIKFEIESQSLEVTRSKAFDNRIKHRNEWMLFKLRSFNALKVDGNIKYEKCWVTQRRLISLVMSIKENYHKFSDFLELCELLMLSYDAALVIRRFSITLLMS